MYQPRSFGLKKIKEFGAKLVYSKHMLWGVGLASFLESIIVPIPLETILIPLMQARRDKILIISTVALIGCLLGASVGYAVGYFVFEAIGQQLISWLSTPEQFEYVRQQMNEKGFLFVFSVGVTPVPFQIAMLAAGATKYSLLLFLAASGMSRAIRYYGLGFLVWVAGNKAQYLFEKHKVLFSLVLIAVVALIWWISILC
jgi:membrane protein YqaA with SNARE-associated domain